MGTKIYYIVEAIIFAGIGYGGLFKTKSIVEKYLKSNEKFMIIVRVGGIIAIIYAIMNLVNLF